MACLAVIYFLQLLCKLWGFELKYLIKLAEGIPTFSIFLVFMVLFVWVGISFLSSTF